MTGVRWRRALWPLLLAASIGLAGCSGLFGSDAAPGKAGSPELASLLRLGAAAEAAGDVGNAVSVYQRAQALYPAAVEPPRRLGDLYRGRALYDLAVRAYRDAVAAAPGDRDARHGLAAALTRQGQLREAGEQYDALLAGDPADIRAWNGKGVVQDLGGDHAAAWESFRGGLKLAPDNLALRTNLGLSLALGGRLDEAIPMLERAAAEPGAGSETRQNLALAYGLAGRSQDAARLGQKDLAKGDVARNLEVYDMMRTASPPRTN